MNYDFGWMYTDEHTAYDTPDADQRRKAVDAAVRHLGLIAVSATQVGEYTHVVIRKRGPNE